MNLSKSKIFLYCCLVFMAGIGIASFLPVSLVRHSLWWFSAVMAFAVILALLWSKQKIRLAAWVGLFLFLGIWRYAIGLPANTLDNIWHYNGQEITARGAVVNEPDIRVRNQKLAIEVGTIQTGAIHELPLSGVSGKILVTTNLYPEYDYGDELEIICQLQAPEQFQGFAYDRYLARYDIYSVCYYPGIRPVCLTADWSEDGPTDFSSRKVCNSGNWFYKNIFSFKDKLRGRINRGLGEPEASLARAIVLGDKKGIPDDLRATFSRAGISHIVAISGMHISIIAVILMWLLLGIGLPRRYAFYLASLFLLFYITLIGLPASAMRAGLMGFLVLLALHLGRLNQLTRSLALAGTVLLLINPRLLRDDIGFQLSFLAVLGIAYIYPMFNQWLDKAKIPKLKGMRDILNITISAQIFTLPVIAYNFSQVSLIAPLSNLLILWILPVLMAVVLSALVLSFVLSGMAVVFFAPVWLILKYIIKVSEFMVAVPYSYAEINYIWMGWAVLWYIGWGAVIYWLKKQTTE